MESGNKERVRSWLAESRFTEGMTDQELNLVAAAGTAKTAVAGTKLLTEGRSEENVFVIHAGHVALEMQIPRRGPVRLLTAGPGDLVGWSGLVNSGPMSASAVATEDCELIRFSATELLNLCDDDPRLGYLLMHRTARAIARRLLATRLQLLDLYS